MALKSSVEDVALHEDRRGVGRQRIGRALSRSVHAQGERKHRETHSSSKLDAFKHWAEQLVLDSGKRLKLEEFQLAFAADVLAGIPECWLILPEGNGKTTLLAALALFHIDNVSEASAPVAAASREQAEILYLQAEGFVKRTKRLRSRFRPLPGYRRIWGRDDTSRIQVFAADDKTGDGVIPTFAMIDEPHRQKDLGLYRTWRGKIDKRGGQIVLISTSGEPGSEFENALERLRQLLPVVKRTETYLHARSETVALHVWALPEDGDVENFELVKRANPLSTITVAKLKQKYESPTMDLAHWRRFVCNLPTRAATAAITEAEWARAKTATQIPPGTRIWIGLDVAWKWDTTAIVPYWSPQPTFRLFGPARVLVPPRNGDSLDPEAIQSAILRLHADTPIHTAVMDTSDAHELEEWLKAELGVTVIPRTQNNATAAQDYASFMEALRNGWLHHTGDVALTTHALNAVAKTLQDTGKTRFERTSRSREAPLQNRRVVDALTAAAMVHFAASTVVSSPPVAFAAAWR